ncbi:MAG: hypothetical protein WCF07_15320 [Nitrososphaeraceae archaeon]
MQYLIQIICMTLKLKNPNRRKASGNIESSPLEVLLMGIVFVVVFIERKLMTKATT